MVTPAPATGGRPRTAKKLPASVEGARQRLDVTRQRLESQRPRRPHLDLAFRTVERDITRGGGLLAGALAYRFFFWLLPFVLVLVGGLGLLSTTDDSAPGELAERAGVIGLAAQSITTAATDSEDTWLWAVLAGLIALYVASLSFLRSLRTAHALIWGVPRGRSAHKAVAAAAMTGVLVLAFLSVGVASAVRARSGPLGVIASVLIVPLVVAGLWWFVSWHLPRAPATRLELLPGAVAVGVGAQLVHLGTVYYVSRRVAEASESYGALGGATGILLSLYFLARVVVVAAALNAELWARRHAPDPPTGMTGHLPDGGAA